VNEPSFANLVAKLGLTPYLLLLHQDFLSATTHDWVNMFESMLLTLLHFSQVIYSSINLNSVFDTLGGFGHRVTEPSFLSHRYSLGYRSPT